MTSSDEERRILRMLSELQAPAYRLFEHFLPVGGPADLSIVTAYQLCESRDVITPMARSWHGLTELLATANEIVSRRPPEMIWPALRGLAHAEVQEGVGCRMFPVGDGTWLRRSDAVRDCAFAAVGEIDIVGTLSLGSHPALREPGGIALAQCIGSEDLGVLLFCALDDAATLDAQIRRYSARTQWVRSWQGS
jgi:hypothetical protein